jgi:hypothetical protein
MGEDGDGERRLGPWLRGSYITPPSPHREAASRYDRSAWPLVMVMILTGSDLEGHGDLARACRRHGCRGR